MSTRCPRRQPAQPEATPAPAYPTVREHLLTRRNALAWMGASLAGGAILASCGTDGVAPSPAPTRLRVPAYGVLDVVLEAGGLLTAFVTLTLWERDVYNPARDDELLREAGEETLSRRSYVELLAAYQGSAPHLRAVESALEQSMATALSMVDPSNVTAALTVVELAM